MISDFIMFIGKVFNFNSYIEITLLISYGGQARQGVMEWMVLSWVDSKEEVMKDKKGNTITQ